jgi:hypothetical protein
VVVVLKSVVIVVKNVLTNGIEGHNMNERIKELYNTVSGDDKLNFDSYLAEKFAELILQDIDRIIDELYHAMPLGQASVLLTLDENIKEHFYEVKS